MPSRQVGPVIAGPSSNRKLAAKPRGCLATHVGQQTCPASCPWLGAGCYAEHGPQGMFVTSRLTRSSLRTPMRAESRAIRALPTDGRPLRIHVVGDAPTNAYARALASAVADWQARGGGPVWCYTHAWRRVRRAAWGTRISILASVETDADVTHAHRRGYATARTVDGFPTPKVYASPASRILPCPVQTGRTLACDTCKLCWHADRLLASNLTIGFNVHGARVSKMRATLANLAAEPRSETTHGN